MDKAETINRVRALGFMAGVIERQGREPLCSQCISYALTVDVTREALESVQASMDQAELDKGFEKVFMEAAGTIKAAKAPDDPIKQRKTGKCKLPDKACFVKKSRRIFLYFTD